MMLIDNKGEPKNYKNMDVCSQKQIVGYGEIA